MEKLANYISALEKCKNELHTPEDLNKLKDDIKKLFEQSMQSVFLMLSGGMTIDENDEIKENYNEWRSELLVALDENVRADNLAEVIDACDTLLFVLNDHAEQQYLESIEINPDNIWKVPGMFLTEDMIQMAMDRGAITSDNLESLKEKAKDDVVKNSSRNFRDIMDDIDKNQPVVGGDAR